MLVLAFAVVVGGVALVRGPTEPRRIVVYGDSLTAQSMGYFRDLLAGEDVKVTIGGVYGGTALCDWLAKMRDDATVLEPDAVLIQFAGNNYSPCMLEAGGQPPGREATAERYERDAVAAVTAFVPHGTRVYLVAPPGNVGTRGPGPLRGRYAAVAGAWSPDVRFVDAGAALRGDDGTYPARLPCLASEGRDEGCARGTVGVRATDGGHFCQTTDPASACPSYASGARRFATAMATPLRRDLGL